MFLDKKPSINYFNPCLCAMIFEETGSNVPSRHQKHGVSQNSETVKLDSN